MWTYLTQRLAQLIVVIIGVAFLIFLILHLAPGDPIVSLLGESATAEQIARTRAAYGLDRPLPAQFARFLSSAATGQFETSIRQRIPAGQLVFERLPRTLLLVTLSALIAVLLGLTLGVLTGLRRESITDYVLSFIAFLGISVPTFWLGIMMILVFSVALGWLPVLSRWVDPIVVINEAWRGNLEPLTVLARSLAMPVALNSVWMLALIMRMTRTSSLEELTKDYIRTARAKGVRERTVIAKHMLRNALLPVITIVGIQFGALISGSVVTETVFGWPGMGLLLIDAVFERDFPVVQAVVVISTLIIAVVNLLTDLSYAIVNPRIRFG